MHHGNSTQKIFYNDEQILYISIHKYLNGSFYPSNTCADCDQLGSDKGVGFNLNFPLNPPSEEHFVGDENYIYIFERFIFPILKQWNPEFIIISSGFDCMKNDPLGGQHVSKLSLGFMLSRMMEKIQSKIVVALEGGYNTDNISETSEYLIRILLGEYGYLIKPDQIDEFQMVHKEMLLPWFQKDCTKVLQFWSQHWSVLKDKSLLEYENFLLLRYQEKEKSPFWVFRNYVLMNDRLVKKISEEEYEFYNNVYPLCDEFH